jgi:hypothetical protein
MRLQAMNWINVAQDRGKWLDIVSKAMDFWVA